MKSLACFALPLFRCAAQPVEGTEARGAEAAELKAQPSSKLGPLFVFPRRGAGHQTGGGLA